MPSNADVVSLQMEKVRSKLQEIFETSAKASAMVKRTAEVEQISTRDYRIPLVVANGGDYGTFDPDGGDMGRGSGPQFVHMIGTYFPVKFAVELTSLQMYATATSERAVAKVFARAMKTAMSEFQAYDDASFHGKADAVFATATAQATVGGFTQFTLDTVRATQLCRRGAKCHVYDTTLATQRAGGPFRITAVDTQNNKVTMSATIAAAAATDKLLFDGVSGATPAWKKGLYLFNDDTASGNLLSLSKSANPEIIASRVNANSATLNAAHAMFLIDQMTQRRDNLGNLKGLAHQKQRTAWYQLGIQISEWSRGKSDEMIDIVPKQGSDGLAQFSFGGIIHMVDKHQNRDRIDWFDPKMMGRAVLKDLDYHTVEGRRLFELRGASGGVAAGMIFYLEQLEDWVNFDPGAGGYIDNLAIPAL